MENKYYTPEINEFYIGFEYEYKLNNEYCNVAFHPSDMVEYARFQKDLYYDNLIRVKYLDKDDIKSLGFKYIDYTVKNFEFILAYCNDVNINNFKCYNINKYQNLFFDNSSNAVHNIIITTTINGNNIPKLIGNIKNKSELKQILKMIGHESN